MTTPFKQKGWPGYQNSPMQDTNPHTGINPIHGPEDHGNPNPGTGTKTTEKETEEKTADITRYQNRIRVLLAYIKAGDPKENWAEELDQLREKIKNLKK